MSLQDYPDSDGQAADAIVSAHTQVKMEDAPRFHVRSGQKHGQTLKIQWSFLNEICTVTHLHASCREDSSRKLCWNLDRKKYRIGNACLFIESKGYSYRIYVDDIKMARKKQYMALMRMKLMKNVDNDERTSFLEHVRLRCAQRERKPNEIIIEEKTKMLESRKSYQGVQRRLRGPLTWKDMVENALRDTASWQTKKVDSTTKFQVFAWMTINASRRNSNQLENCHKYAH